MAWVPSHPQRTAVLTWTQAGRRSLQVPDAKVPPLTYLPRTRGLTSISESGQDRWPGGGVPNTWWGAHHLRGEWTGGRGLHTPPPPGPFHLPLSEVVPCVLRPGRAASLSDYL